MEGLYENYSYMPQYSAHSNGQPFNPYIIYRPSLPLQPMNSHAFQWPASHQQAPPSNYSYRDTNSDMSVFPKVSTNLWEDQETLCYHVDARGIRVARRQDNDMINGTKLLNVVGMSRGKRDGILKNEKGRVVVKVGAMHLKGVWITFERAKELANKFKIFDLLFPLLVDDPSVLSCPTPPLLNKMPFQPRWNYGEDPLYSHHDCSLKEPTTPSSWYSPETPTAVLQKRKRSLSTDGLLGNKILKLESFV